MATSRYTTTPRIALGRRYGTARYMRDIREALNAGRVRRIGRRVVAAGERLDIIANEEYGDPGYWWVLAAASGIGWAPQVPPGTVLTVVDIADVESLLREA